VGSKRTHTAAWPCHQQHTQTHTHTHTPIRGFFAVWGCRVSVRRVIIEIISGWSRYAANAEPQPETGDHVSWGLGEVCHKGPKKMVKRMVLGKCNIWDVISLLLVCCVGSGELRAVSEWHWSGTSSRACVKTGYYFTTIPLSFTVAT
jgi:hypothetical protein